jgi:dihydroorotase
MTAYDLLITGGEVVDPGLGLREKLDVAIADGRVAAMEIDIPPAQAREVVDATGKLVTPGLIDLHAHVYFACTPLSVEVDGVAARSGVTTTVDAGSAGAQTFPGFRRYIVEAARSRVLAFLNISAIGILGIHEDEAAQIANCSVEEAVHTVEENRDVVVGIKMRASAEVVGDHDVVPLELARAAADRTGLPLMVHIGQSPPSLGPILERMKEGDILTHLFTGYDDRIINEEGKARNRIIDGEGRVRREVKKAREAGVIMDVGHGSGSFNFKVAEAALAQGFKPDTISTDLHTESIEGPVYDLPTTMSKFLNLGMSLEEVILAATARPAEAIGRKGELGTLQVGAVADVALFELQEGRFEFHDAYGNVRDGSLKLVNALTICRGRMLG